MKLYEEPRAPNPRRVRIFLAEKGISVPRVSIDINKMEHKTPEFAALNPLQRTPALQLDDGTVIAESIAICRYLDCKPGDILDYDPSDADLDVGPPQDGEAD